MALQFVAMGHHAAVLRYSVAPANELTATPDGGAYMPDCSVWMSLVKTWLKNL